MEDTLYKIYLYVIVPLLTIVGGLALYYFHQRLINAATKDDIKELTKIAQGVKDELALLHDSKLSFQTLRREAIVNYHRALLKLVNHLVSLQLSEHTGNEQRVIAESRAPKFAGLVSKLDNAEANLRLFLVQFSSLHPTINAITKATVQQGRSYEFYSDKLISIDRNVHLVPDAIRDYDKDRLDFANEVFVHIQNLEASLRDYIKQSLS